MTFCVLRGTCLKVLYASEYLNIMLTVNNRLKEINSSRDSSRESSSFSDSQFDLFSDDFFDEPLQREKNRWSISWSDLMMTMFIFFVIMYVYQVGNRELKFDDGPGRQTVSDAGSGVINDVDLSEKESDVLTDVATRLIKDEWVDNEVTIDLVKDQAVRITLAGDFFFDVGRADLKPESKWRLHQIANTLKKSKHIINVVGHTDSVPNHSALFPTNWELSAARACRVARYLIENEGIREHRFFISAHSWHQPVVPNTNVYNRSLNRRVELILLKEMPSGVPAATESSALLRVD